MNSTEKKYNYACDTRTITNFIILNFVFFSVIALIALFYLTFSAFVLVLIFQIIYNLAVLRVFKQKIIITKEDIVLKNLFSDKKLDLSLIEEIKIATKYDLNAFRPSEKSWNYFGKQGAYRSRNHKLIYAYSYSNLYSENVIIFYSEIIYLISVKESPKFIQDVKETKKYLKEN